VRCYAAYMLEELSLTVQIVLNPPTYPNFLRFLRLLKIPLLSTEMTFSVSRDRGRFEWAGEGLGGIFCQMSNLCVTRWHCQLELPQTDMAQVQPQTLQNGFRCPTLQFVCTGHTSQRAERTRAQHWRVSRARRLQRWLQGGLSFGQFPGPDALAKSFDHHSQ